jgi:hypothetical protein
MPFFPYGLLSWYHCGVRYDEKTVVTPYSCFPIHYSLYAICASVSCGLPGTVLIQACMPKPGSMPEFFKAFAFRSSMVFLAAFCDAASARTSSSGTNFRPLGLSSLSKSTVAQMVTFSPRTVMTPGSLTSQASQFGVVASACASGFLADIRSQHSVRTRLAEDR